MLTDTCQRLRDTLKQLAFFYPSVVNIFYAEKTLKPICLEIPNPKAWFLEAQTCIMKVSSFVKVREESLLSVLGTLTWLLFSSKLFYLWGLFVDVVHRV